MKDIIKWLFSLVIFIFIVLFLNSCSKPSKDYEFNEEYLITTKSYLGDSLLSDRNSEYIANIKIKEDNYNWTKRYFSRDLFLEELDYEEEIIIDCNINSESIITSMNNWDEIYEKIETYIKYIKDNYSRENKEINENLLALMTDSLLIQNKNTKDIRIFNCAYHLYLGDDKELVDSFSKKLIDGNLVYKLTYVIDMNEASNLVNEISEQEIKFNNSGFSEIEIIIDTENYTIERIIHTTEIAVEDEDYVKAIIEMTPYFERKDMGF